MAADFLNQRVPPNILEGKRNSAFINFSSPSTAKPKILKGIESSQKTRYNGKAKSASGQQINRRSSHKRNVNILLPFFSYDELDNMKVQYPCNLFLGFLVLIITDNKL